MRGHRVQSSLGQPGTNVVAVLPQVEDRVCPAMRNRRAREAIIRPVHSFQQNTGYTALNERRINVVRRAVLSAPVRLLLQPHPLARRPDGRRVPA